jgi:ketohexokinase
MSQILAVGIATLDIVNTVATFPSEDSEVRALSQRRSRGGNATNTLVVLSQLGHTCSWAGTLASEPDTQHISADLSDYGIDTNAVVVLPHGKVPTSYIVLNQTNGSRTIVHYRDLPEYGFDAFRRIDLSRYDWIHFEGRNVSATCDMLHYARHTFPSVPISVEVEKPRADVERLFPLATVLIFSRAFALSAGHTDAAAFLRAMRDAAPHSDLIAAWGEQGAYGMGHNDKSLYHKPAVRPPQIIDTLGAGDTFNAGIIDGILRGLNLPETLTHANTLAGKKCGQLGLHLLERTTASPLSDKNLR